MSGTPPEWARSVRVAVVQSDRGDCRAPIVVSVNLGDDPVVYDVGVVEVDAATLAGVWPLHVQQDCDTFRADDGAGHVAVDAFAEKPIEGRDHVGAASALVWVVLVAPPGFVGQAPPQRVEVLVCERRAASGSPPSFHASALHRSRFLSCST